MTQPNEIHYIILCLLIVLERVCLLAVVALSIHSHQKKKPKIRKSLLLQRGMNLIFVGYWELPLNMVKISVMFFGLGVYPKGSLVISLVHVCVYL